MFSQQASTVCYRRQKGNRHKDQLWGHLSEGSFLPKSTKGQCYLRELHLLWLSCNKFRYLQKIRTFLKILDEELKKRENRVLHKIFNRNKVKISDSCMPNLAETLHPQVWKHATTGYQLTALWSGKSTSWCQPKLMLDPLGPLLKQDLPITNLLSTTPTRDTVQTPVGRLKI